MQMTKGRKEPVVLFHVHDLQQLDLLSAAQKHNWDYRTHCWTKGTVHTDGARFRSNLELWFVFFKGTEAGAVMNYDQKHPTRYRYMDRGKQMRKISNNHLFNRRYCCGIHLGQMMNEKKFKFNGRVLNESQKPLLLFMKHLLSYCPNPGCVLDITAGSGTTAVSKIL